MDFAISALREFFEHYARSRTAMNIDGIVSQYADRCMLAAHDGVRVAEKPELLEGFSKVLEFLKTVGHTRTSLASFSEASVDEHYAMVRAQFVWRFEKAAALPIDVTVDSAFVLYLKDGVPRIVFHHEHEDFGQLLQRRGVIPAQG
jgi:hypothetical protein